jgi:hypothetical protein
MKNRLPEIYLLFLVFAVSLSVEGAPPGIPKLQSTVSANEISMYQSAVQALTAKPEMLQTLSSWDLKMILYNLSGVTVKDKISVDQWQKIRMAETKVIGLVISCAKSRINFSIDEAKMSFPLSYPTYEQTHPSDADKSNSTERDQYNKEIAAKIKYNNYLNDQVQMKNAFSDFTQVAKDYLKMLYSGQETQTSGEGEILKSCGLDSKTIDSLTK